MVLPVVPGAAAATTAPLVLLSVSALPQPPVRKPMIHSMCFKIGLNFNNVSLT